MYPITLTTNWQAVVIGGGQVGERKVRGLLNVAIPVHLISPTATVALQAWAKAGQIDWLARTYQPGDLAGYQLVFAATDQREVNAQVAQAAQSLGLLCNVADTPDEGSFHVPAVYRSPAVMVAVSTFGENPALARRLRDKIAHWLEEQL